MTGFGYFAERAEVEGFPYFNVSLSGKGAKYPDPKSKFFASENTFLLLTLGLPPTPLRAEFRELTTGKTLDSTTWEPRKR